MAVRRSAIAVILAVLLAAAVGASLALGAVHIPLGQVIDVLLGRDAPRPVEQIIEILRLPRTVEALIVGAALGIAVAALFSAGTASLMAAFPDRVPGGIFFLVGGLSSTGWETLSHVWPYFAVGFVLAAFMVRPLDRLMLGDDVAASLGSNPRRIRLVSAFAAAVLASAAAAVAGLLAFLGLLVPHMVRLLGGTNNHTYVVPVSALAGAALLVAGDTLARTVVAPIEMPVGPFLVILGVPLFLWLLRKAV